MAKMTFGSKAGRIRTSTATDAGQPTRSTDEVIRELKKAMEKPVGEDYRDRSLSIHGLVCARCGREFEQATRHLLTVHHRDHNHQNNPPDGSNWENLCVYCHDDAHSRSVLAEYVGGQTADKGSRLVYEDSPQEAASPGLGELLAKAMREKKSKGG
jgi:hypothetical protein